MVDIEALLEGVNPPYFANSKWEPGNPVYYSGPYWDNQELGAAVNGLLNGKWLASGEKVYEFEKKFSKHFNKGYSLMVNSGSSANLIMIAALKKRFGWQDGDEIIVSCVGFPTTICLLYTSPSPRDLSTSRMPSSA